MRVGLEPHPALASAAARRIEVDVARPAPGRLELRYHVFGEIGRLRLPPTSASQRTDELWKHTCFEAFIRPGAGPAYWELNLAPSTEWAAYRFESERAGMRVAQQVGAPTITTERHDDRFDLVAAVTLDLPGDPTWRLGLTAVIEDTEGGKSYWAITHPAAQPDFHHPGGFTIELPAVGQT